MKTLITFGCIAAVVLGLNACNKDNLSPNADTSAARSSATDSLHRGKPGSLTAVATSSLPAAITTYINANYAGATIKEALKDSQGNFVVMITLNNTVKLLAFKADGTFVKELAPRNGHAPGDTTHRPHHTPGDTAHHPRPALGDSTHHPRGDSAHHPRPMPLTAVAVTDLPAAVTTYITTNYAGATIKRAAKDTTTGDFFVEITTADKKRVGLIFGANGTFKKAITGR